MILDSSAIAAVVFKEPGFEALVGKIAEAETIGIGAPTLAETAVVLTSRLRRDSRGLLLKLLQEWQVAIVPFGPEHWKEAAEAYVRFGRGQHRAALNFGDCLAYAVARLSGESLLCVGRDFSRTDLELA